MIWKYHKETSTALPSLRWGDYVISIRGGVGMYRTTCPFMVSYRPKGHWFSLGEYETPERAIGACEEHWEGIVNKEYVT